MGNFTSYSESSARTRPAGTSINLDWFVQDSWKATRRLTLEIGMRVAYYTPWYHWHGFATNFPLERFDRDKAPVLFRPACIGASRCSGANRVPVNPLNGQMSPVLALLAGAAFVPGTGDPANGSITAKEPNYPRGFIENVGEMFQPRSGFAWDVFGTSQPLPGVQNGAVYFDTRTEPRAHASGPADALRLTCFQYQIPDRL